MSFPKIEIRRRPSMALFAVSAIAMVIGSYLFVLLLAAACVYLPYLILANSDSFSPQIGLLFLFGIVIAVAMLWSLIPRSDKFEAPGMLLDHETQPRLFSELESIASALNETLPSEVYLIGAPNAFVADRGVPRRTPRRKLHPWNRKRRAKGVLTRGAVAIVCFQGFPLLPETGVAVQCRICVGYHAAAGVF
jgi:hypothetical protein